MGNGERESSIAQRGAAAKLAATIVAMLLSSLIILPVAFSLGVTPGRTEMAFKPETHKQITLTMINNEHKDMRALVYSEGSLKGFVNVQPTIIEFKAGESAKRYSFDLALPKNINTPGTNEIKIMIKELPADQATGEDAAKITATVEVMHQLRIMVPYPGKYLDADFIADVDSTEAASDFTLPLHNKGKNDLKDIKADIEIIDAYTGKKTDEIETAAISLASGAKGKLTANLNKELQRGKYLAKIKISYDGKSLDFEREFFAGTPTISIASITVDKFSLGSIAKFDMWLENQWNSRLDGVSAEFLITDYQGKEKGKFKTAETGIDSGSLGQLQGYWDTADANPGEHSLKIILKYAGIVREQLYKMQVGIDKITIEGAGATGAVIGRGNIGLTSNKALAWGVVALIVINAGLAAFLFRRKGKGKSDGNMPKTTIGTTATAAAREQQTTLTGQTTISQDQAQRQQNQQ